MGSLIKWTSCLLLLTGCLPAVPALQRSEATKLVDAPIASVPTDIGTNTLQTARSYSFIVRDRGLSRDETLALLQDPTQLRSRITEWLSGDDHSQRMQRYFNDMLGFRDQLAVLQPNARLNKSAENIYFVARKGGCDSKDAVPASAWWLPGDQTALFCPNLVSSALTVTDGDRTINCSKSGTNGFLHPLCGCGPDMINCIAPEEANLLQEEVQNEFSRRALQVYRNDGGWLDLLAASKFYGTRRLYWLYFQGQVAADPKLYTPEALQIIRTLPLDHAEERVYPDGPERSGISTAPGFLVQYNNFRSRIAGLTRSLLCQDVDPTLNTDGIQIFVNPSLKPADLAHGSKAECAGCHYALDNLGGALMPWTDRALFQAKVSTASHAFGLSGQGPAFLMRGYVERAPGFNDCMSRRAWEDFSGQPWSETPEQIKTKIRSWAADGPQALIQSLILSTELMTALTQGPASTTPDDLSPDEWARVQVIVQQSCAGSSCHSTGARLAPYAETSALWVSDRQKLSDRLQRSGAGRMPPPNRTLSDTDRQTLLQILDSASLSSKLTLKSEIH